MRREQQPGLLPSWEQRGSPKKDLMLQIPKLEKEMEVERRKIWNISMGTSLEKVNSA